MTRPSWPLIWMKIQISAKTLWWLFVQPVYAAIAIVLAFGFFELVYWMFNLATFFSLMTTGNLGIADKASVLFSPFTSMQLQNGAFIFIFMILLAILQGLSLSALIYAMRHQPKTDSKLLGGSAVLGFLAVVGLGCPACGTSLITPVVALFVSGSAVAVSEQITAIALPLAILIGLYGLYVLGLRISTIKVQLTA